VAILSLKPKQAKRALAFKDFQVNNDLMQQANADASFMHCLPAHREEEVSGFSLERYESNQWLWRACC
jgi:ornithine carbamoyltransferase